MSKIPIELHAPLDILCIKSSEPFFPLFNKYKITPNHITYVSIIFAGLSIYYLYFDVCPKKAVILFFLQYILDCWDGHYARYSNQETELGDKLDHYKDLIILGAIVYYILKNWNISYNYLLILIVFSLITNIHYSCTDHYYYKIIKNDEISLDKNVLSNLKDLCYIPKRYNKNKNSLDKWLNKMLYITSFLGNGTVILYIIYLIYKVSPISDC